MSQHLKRVPLIMLCMMILVAMGSTMGDPESFASPAETVATVQTKSPAEPAEALTPDSPEEEETYVDPEEPELDPVDARWAGYPNHCESFTVTEGTKRVKNKRGDKVWPVYYKRNRYKRKRSDQRRTRKLIRMVAKEMGADEEGQYLVDMIAYHESSFNPEAIHILNPDLDANQKAWGRYTYNKSREAELERKLSEADARGKKFWSIKRTLSNLRLYKGNEYWDSRLKYTYQIPERTLGDETYKASEWEESRSVWAFGYGLYGMNAVLYTHVFDRQAPPWILCGDEGIAATITIIWALREQQRDCAYLTDQDSKKWGPDGGNARGVVRRFARGQCSNKRLGKAWQKLFNKYEDHVTRDDTPDFGNKWPKYEMYRRGGKLRYRLDDKRRRIRTDPEAVLAHMRSKAEEKGLLRPEPLERRHPDHKPQIVARNASVPVGAL